jgi:hypothetical protein
MGAQLLHVRLHGAGILTGTAGTLQHLAYGGQFGGEFTCRREVLVPFQQYARRPGTGT